MTRPLALALALCLGAASIGCADSPTAPASTRSLSAFVPFLTTTLTPDAARAHFGAPDEQQGSGLRIYVYRLTDGRRLFLGFPGDAPILYARVFNADGSTTDLSLR
jgi:hypothetical protein